MSVRGSPVRGGGLRSPFNEKHRRTISTYPHISKFWIKGQHYGPEVSASFRSSR